MDEIDQKQEFKLCVVWKRGDSNWNLVKKELLLLFFKFLSLSLFSEDKQV